MAGSYAEVAQWLVDELSPFCQRVEIGGSIRRGSMMPNDIEIVAIPSFVKEAVEPTGQMRLGGEPQRFVDKNLLDGQLNEWKAASYLTDRCDKNNRRAWGDRFKRAVVYPPHMARGFALDLFSVIPPAQWGVIFAIRTGPEEFSKAFVTSRLQRGYLPPDMQIKHGGLYVGGALRSTPEEEDFFRAIGLPCWPPEERGLERLHEWRSETAPA